MIAANDLEKVSMDRKGAGGGEKYFLLPLFQILKTSYNMYVFMKKLRRHKVKSIKIIRMTGIRSRILVMRQSRTPLGIFRRKITLFSNLFAQCLLKFIKFIVTKNWKQHNFWLPTREIDWRAVNNLSRVNVYDQGCPTF